MKFLNTEVEKRYRAQDGAMDCEIVLPAIGWRSKLSRITPRIAERLIAQGSNLILKKDVVLQLVISPTQSVDIAVVPPLTEDIPEVVVVLPTREVATQPQTNPQTETTPVLSKKLAKPKRTAKPKL